MVSNSARLDVRHSRSTNETSSVLSGFRETVTRPTGSHNLAPYATQLGVSRGRVHCEPACATRNAFARDRDRVLHSTAFRRLNHKTQVFVHYEGDHYRSRLTHSLEVAQIARSLARILKLNEDLAEAISLAHDLGHTPFGHAGERALNRAMVAHGGFDHNIQSLRVVTRLEQRYADFDGLNLTWETLEGLIKHNGPVAPSDGVTNPYPPSWLHEIISDFPGARLLELTRQAGPEAQVAAIADDIAYNNHDLDDGYRAGLFVLDDLAELTVLAPIIEDIRSDHPGLAACRMIYETNRRLITAMIADVRAEAKSRLAGLKPVCVDDIRSADAPVIAFSETFAGKLRELEGFLFERVYRHDRVMEIMGDAESIVEEVARHFMNRPKDMPHSWQSGLAESDLERRAERVRDFVAGMTDRFALKTHRSLFDVTPELR